MLHHRESAGPRSPLFLLTILLAALSSLPAFAAVAPSHPGSSAEGAFGHLRGAEPEGTAILNVNSGMTFPTIQDAVNAATAGDTLEVQAASHSEGQILIDRSLTLRGATGTEEVLMAVDTGSSGDGRAWFLVLPGVDLQVRNLTFDGNGFLVHQAFRHRGTGAFEDCTFRDIQFNPSTNYAGTAIVAFGGTVDVRRTIFSQIGRVGVLLFGTGVVGAVVEDNTYVGKGDGDFLDYGFEFGAGATGTLTGNSVSDNRGVASVDGSTSAGILASTFFGAGTAGTVNSNLLSSNSVGIAIGFMADTTVLDASFNRIVGNDTGLHSTSTAAVTAEQNWWGCNAGPSDGACDDVSGNPTVPDFDPWLVLSLMADPTTVAVNGTSDLTADLNRDSDGGAAAGTVPDGTPVDFSSAPGTVNPAVASTTAGEAASTFTAPPAPGSATVSANVDNETVDETIQVEGSADLAITKSASPDPAQVGVPLIYTLMVSNNGPTGATGVTVVDTLPATVSFDSATASQGLCMEAAGTVTCDLGALADGASATIMITVIPNAAGVLLNAAVVSANEGDPVSINNTGQVVTGIAGNPVVIPTASSVGLVLLSLLLAGAAIWRLRRG